jgi:hypothetical protein
MYCDALFELAKLIEKATRRRLIVTRVSWRNIPITLKTPNCVGHSSRRAEGGSQEGRDGMPVSDTRNLATGVRKVEFKLSQISTPPNPLPTPTSPNIPS